MINRTLLVNKLFKKLWVALAVLIILAAVVSSIFRSLTPWAKEYKGEVENHLSLLLGQPVTIQAMQTGWYWFEPVLKLQQVVVKEGDKNTLHLEKLLVGINLFKSLWNWRIQPGVLYIDDVDLVFREVDGHWTIDGISTNTKDNKMTAQDTQKIWAWLSQQEHLIIRHVSARFHFSDGGIIPVSGLNVSVVNRSGHYKLKGTAHLEQTTSSAFELLGDLYLDPNNLHNTKGQIFFSAKNLSLAQWQSIFPQARERIEGGRGDIALWVDLNKGTVSQLQAQVKIKRLAWRIAAKKDRQLIPIIYANLAWKPSDNGWQLNADHIKLSTGGINWPENQLSIQFDKQQNTHHVYVKTINIENVLSSGIDWPDSLHNILELKPQGVLTDTQVIVKDQQMQVVLSRFDQLGWNAQETIPEVRNLSGVLNWQTDEGRLELDSENVSLTAKGYPPQRFKLLNAAIDWKQLSDGMRVSIERLAMNQPELTLSAEGAIDQVTVNSVGHIRMNANFAGKNIQQWAVFLPVKHMKAKLYNWLKNDIKRVAAVSGKMTINGMAKDFPFDNSSGEFSITGHASGGEILITPKWQLVKDVEGYIRLKKRNLEIDIVNADFQGVPVKQLQLRIDDIGRDRENLLVHGIIDGAAQKMLNFVLNSPLKEKLKALDILKIKGLFGLNLRLEIPLYPENDHNLAQGNLVFKNNTILVKHQLGVFPLEEVNGELSFTEKGVTQSTLSASSLGYPMTIQIVSEQLPQAATTLLINAEYTIESLKSQLNIPILALCKGMFNIKALLRITDDPNALDHLELSSNLKGLAIKLPAPLGKIYDTEVPFEVNIAFNPQKQQLRLRANYHGRISSDVNFAETNGVFELKSGQIRLGSAQALDQNKPGVAIVGTLDGFDLQEWHDVLSQYSNQESNSSLLKKLRIINVKMSKVAFLQQSFDDLSIKAKLLNNNNWSLNLEQKKVAADLTYNQANNLISGFVNHLNLAKINNFNTSTKSSLLNPGQIPNLNLRIDNLSIGDIDLGNMTLKSHSTPERWLIDYCRIDSDVYQFNVDGEWTQKNKINQTKMHVKLTLKELAKGLERWHITPAVDANNGDLEFRGGWNDSLNKFSLASLNGTMFLQLKNGRITHLSPEAEEKLGLGKLLSILSLQTIPRRLKLDFSDLSQQGYSFDIFKGNFNITKGIMTTQDSYIDGPVAYASMKGDLDLVRRMYDLDLTISPHIMASLPVVATIAGGPIAGIAAWVANKIINKSMQKIVAYSYKVSGPWNQPVVQQLTMIKKTIKSEHS